MKDIAFAFLATGVEVLADGRLMVVGADVEGFMCPQIPIQVQFSFVAKMSFAPEEISQSHTVNVECEKPDGTRGPICPAVPVVLQLNPYNPTGEIKAIAIAKIGMNFEQPGKYVFHLMVDQKEALARSLGIMEISHGATPLPLGASGICQQPQAQ